MTIANLELTSARGQMVTILLAALFNQKGGRRKQEVLTIIKDQCWFSIEPEDRKPYPGATGDEPRWETLIAWARQDAVEAKLLEHGIRDSWETSKSGHNEFLNVRNAYRAGVHSVRDCFLWAPAMKKFIAPDWSADGTEKLRPKYMYNDLLPIWRASTRGNRSLRLFGDDFLDF